MQYKVYTDKQENFICEINLTGASLGNAKSGIIIATDTLNLMFEGKIGTDGKCKVPINKLAGLLQEGTTGDIRLEVIADDTYFEPWKSNFIVEASKKITVEVKSQNSEIIKESKPTMKVIVESTSKVDRNKHVVNILRTLRTENISIKNIDKKKGKLTAIISDYQSTNNLSESDQKFVIEKISKALEKLS